jgi:FdhD protein
LIFGAISDSHRFSLSEGIVHSPDDIRSLDIIDLDDGIELRMWLTQSNADRFNERRRHIAGPFYRGK